MISEDGNTVLFESDDFNLARDDANEATDVFFWQFVPPASRVNLRLTKSASPNPAVLGSNLVFTHTVTGHDGGAWRQPGSYAPVHCQSRWEHCNPFLAEFGPQLSSRMHREPHAAHPMADRDQWNSGRRAVHELRPYQCPRFNQSVLPAGNPVIEGEVRIGLM